MQLLGHCLAVMILAKANAASMAVHREEDQRPLCVCMQGTSHDQVRIMVFKIVIQTFSSHYRSGSQFQSSGWLQLCFVVMPMLCSINCIVF